MEDRTEMFRPLASGQLDAAASVVHTCCSNALVEDLFDDE